MKTKIVNLNNRSRKGKYVYIKGEGVPGRYYKFKSNNQIKQQKDEYSNKYLGTNIEIKY